VGAAVTELVQEIRAATAARATAGPRGARHHDDSPEP
jgi:hypothetical protein